MQTLNPFLADIQCHLFWHFIIEKISIVCIIENTMAQIMIIILSLKN